MSVGSPDESGTTAVMHCTASYTPNCTNCLYMLSLEDHTRLRSLEEQICKQDPRKCPFLIVMAEDQLGRCQQESAAELLGGSSGKVGPAGL